LNAKSKMELSSFLIDSKISNSLDRIKMTQKYIIILTNNQTLILFDIQRNVSRVKKLKIDLNFTKVEWLLNNFIFCCYNLNGSFIAFDLGFNPIDFHYTSRDGQFNNSLSFYLSSTIFEPFTNKLTKRKNMNKFEQIISLNRIEDNTLWMCFHFSNGPFGLMKLKLPNNFNHNSFVSLYLETNNLKPEDKLNKSINLMKSLNWDDNNEQSKALFIFFYSF
jgi:hypothetical protein